MQELSLTPPASLCGVGEWGLSDLLGSGRGQETQGQFCPTSCPGKIMCCVPQAVWSFWIHTKAWVSVEENNSRFWNVAALVTEKRSHPRAQQRLRRALGSNGALLFLTHGDLWAAGVLLPPGMPHPAASASGTPPFSVRSPAVGQSRSHNFHHLLWHRGLHLL